jgi:hypothetical protein
MANFPRIVIDEQRAQIGISTTQASMRISSPRMNLRVRSQTPQMSLENSQPPRFRADRRQVNAESGLRPPSFVARDQVADGRAGAMRATAQGAQDGYILGDVSSPGDRVSRLARMRTMEAFHSNPNMNIGLMPRSSPSLEWDDAQMRINWSDHSLIIDWEGHHMPQVHIDPPHSVEVYLQSRPYFRIRVVEAPPPQTAGGNIDASI